jgi:hypothetical protein
MTPSTRGTKTKKAAKAAPEAKARKTAKAAPKASTLAPFPFLGQGEANYYEWFELWIWFEAKVAKKARAAVLADAPRLCTLDAQWPHATLLWASTGDQWIQQHLVDEYGTKSAKQRMLKALEAEERERAGEGDGDDDYLDDLIAGGGETAAFNAEIERWLRALHARQPILFVARRQDAEAGGTRLGRWHQASVPLFLERAVPVLEALAAGPALDKEDLRRAPIEIALAYVGPEKVKPALRKLGRE